ncbi:MAG TPA: RodZ domain-containing protein [Bacteroidota bacterium]|nr:RodZ domain-containing protein [Bacteroidota bacterium]
MTLETFGAELRNHREQKQISLASISEATRISERMLEAIEAGKFSVLPQAYIRAFLRAYARSISLDPEEVIRRYDSVNQEIKSVAEEWVSRSKPHVLRAESTPADSQQKSAGVSLPSIVAAVVILLTAAAVIFFANRGSMSPTQEPLSKVPFDKAVRETEAASTPPQQAPAQQETVQQPSQTLQQVSPQPLPQTKPQTQPQASQQVPFVKAAGDSLRLEITTRDTVWVAVVIDNLRRGQYLFPPGRTRTWAAKEQFSVSMGNAGGATFRLNGSNLGALGKRGAVARNVLITQAGIQQVQ